jgi:hypothetical protein
LHRVRTRLGDFLRPGEVDEVQARDADLRINAEAARDSTLKRRTISHAMCRMRHLRRPARREFTPTAAAHGDIRVRAA